MKRALVCLIIVALIHGPSMAMASSKPDKKAAKERGTALIGTLFSSSLKEVSVDLVEMFLSTHTPPGGKPRYWITVFYRDDSVDGDKTALGKVIAICHTVAALSEMDLAEIEARPVTGELANNRAVVVVPNGPTNGPAGLWVKVFTGGAKQLPEADQRAALEWMKSWAIRRFDPNWKLPMLGLN